MTSQRKPSIVFVHGLWADGSCFAKLIPTLPKEGFEESHPSTVWTHMLEMARTSRGLSVESASPRSWSVTLMEDPSSLPLGRTLVSPLSFTSLRLRQMLMRRHKVCRKSFPPQT